jgi:type IV conjugative transfer system coupling protein TraD
MFKTITQGGQVHIHQIRMFKQVFVFGVLLSLFTGGGFFLWRCWTLPSPLWRAAIEVTKAKVLLATTFEEKQRTATQTYTPPSLSGVPYKRRCFEVIRDPFLKRKTQEFWLELKAIGIKSLLAGGLAFLVLMIFWLRRGGSHREIQHQRGTTFMEPKALAKLIRKKRQESDLIVENLPLIKNKETSHTLITGTTGSGKTNLFHTLLPQIRTRGDKAIVVDVTGDYISRYYQEDTDIILNPFDVRALPWTPWADCHTDTHYDILANALIQPKGHSYSDPFWDNASRAVLKAALRKFAKADHQDVEDLYQLFTEATDREFCEFFEGTEATTYASLNNDKTTSSIRSVLNSQIEGLGQLKTPGSPTETFSLRKWIETKNLEGKKGWLFITARADQRKTLIPLISAWVDISMNSFMTLPQDPKQSMWFVIDELPALQKLPCLQLGLAEARKYGGCFLVGFQSKPQLEEIYGDKASHAILDLFNTKFFFRCTEPSTQLWISRVLGDKEEAEPHDTISYGANSMRDGVSLTHQFRHKPLIMPAEFSQLEDLECYVKLPGGYPCTRLKISFQKSRF